MANLFDLAHLITTVGVDGVKIKPEPGLPEKSSNEILTELFRTFDTDADDDVVSLQNNNQQMPNDDNNAAKSIKLQTKKKKSKKKHKHKDKKHKKKLKHNSSDSNSDTEGTSAFPIYQHFIITNFLFI